MTIKALVMLINHYNYNFFVSVVNRHLDSLTAAHGRTYIFVKKAEKKTCLI